MKTLKFITFVILFFIWLPLFSLFQKGSTISGFSDLFTNVDLLASFGNSILLAVISSLICVALSTLTILSLPNWGTKTHTLFYVGLMLPLVLPEIVFGVSYMIWFSNLGLALGWATLLFSHIAFTFGYTGLILKNAFAKIDPQIIDAASDLGAERWTLFRHGVLPQISASLIVAFFVGFSISLDDFLITFFVKGLDQVTLPIKIYSMARLKIGDEIYSLSFLLVLFSTIAVLTSQFLYFRQSRGGHH